MRNLSDGLHLVPTDFICSSQHPSADIEFGKFPSFLGTPSPCQALTFPSARDDVRTSRHAKGAGRPLGDYLKALWRMSAGVDDAATVQSVLNRYMHRRTESCYNPLIRKRFMMMQVPRSLENEALGRYVCCVRQH